MPTFSERLNEALEYRNMTAAELARALNVADATISNYKKGIYAPKQRRTEEISRILNVSVDWLLGADVPMYRLNFEDVPGNIIPLPKMKKIPLLGTIACGEPILAAENIEALINADENLNADFALRCKGDSMINARIFDGDIVYIREQPDVEDGEIAAVLIGEEATLKRVYKYPSKVVLRPENPLYDDMIYSKEEMNEVRILGKAVAQIWNCITFLAFPACLFVK